MRKGSNQWIDMREYGAPSSSISMLSSKRRKKRSSDPLARVHGLMGITESGGRMPIRVTGYDFSRNRANMCPHLPRFSCRLHKSTSFAETVAYYYRLPIFHWLNRPLLPVPWLCRGGLLLWKGCGGNRRFNRSIWVIVRPIDQRVPNRIVVIGRFPLVSSPLEACAAPIASCGSS
jgi:hypothetical protein